MGDGLIVLRAPDAALALQHHTLPCIRDRLPDRGEDLLTLAMTVDIGVVEEGDALLEGNIDELDTLADLLCRDRIPVPGSKLHAAVG